MANKKKNKTDKKVENTSQHGEKTLKLDDLKNFTVGEIVEKSKRVTEENEANESVLDKYIRQHRSEIEQAKDKGLEEFIKSERLKIAKTAENNAAAADENSVSADRNEIAEDSAKNQAADKTDDTDKAQKLSADKPVKAAAAGVLAGAVAEKLASADEAKSADEKVAADDKKSATQENSESDKASDSDNEIDETMPELSDKPDVASKREQFDQVEVAADDNEMISETAQNQPVSDSVSADKITGNEANSDNAGKIAADSRENQAQANSSALTENPEKETVTESALLAGVGAADGLAEAVNSEANEKAQEKSAKPAPTDSTKPENAAANNLRREDKSENSQEKVKKSRKVPIIVGACVVILLGACATYAVHQNSQKSQNVKTTQSSSTKASSKKAAKVNHLAQFNKDYADFFLDSAHTQLRNSEFGKLSNLEKEEAQISDKADQAKAKAKLTALKTQISAINQVNALFSAPIIVDGKLNTGVTVKSGVKIPTSLKTSNKTLDNLLAQAISEAKTQQANQTAKQSKTSQSSSQQAATAKSSTAGSTAKSSNSAASTTENSTSNSNSSSSTQAASSGLSAAGVSLDNSQARVQPQAGLDTSNAAFTWKAGIKELVLNKCRARGYIQGDQYILQPVAIHTTNGSQGPAGIVSGYYNLYAPDGRYLVSINDKTGYFVGNGSGHASALDY